MIFIRNTGAAYNRRSLVELFLHEKPATYTTEQCTVEQCRAGAFRSITEILEIVKTYFPKTTIEDILKIIRDLIQKNANVSLVYCTQVNKVVLKYLDNQTRDFVTNYSLRKFATKKGVDGYSINDYLTIINNL